MVAVYIAVTDGIEVDSIKIEAENTLPTAVTRQDSKSFMGLINQF